MTPEREEKFRKIIRQRQSNLTIILENVHDVHNLSAVMRTCDSVGIGEIYVLYTDVFKRVLEIGKKSSAGTRKWVKVHLFNDVEACFAAVRAKYDKVYATHLSEDAVDLYQMDLSTSCALLFGNEKDGVSFSALQFCDGNFIIPQAGIAQSLNISVACAVTLYEAYRQRDAKGYYDKNSLVSLEEEEVMFQEFKERETFWRKTAPKKRRIFADQPKVKK